MTKDFRARNLIKIDRMEEYDGTTAIVATEHLQPREIEFERWRAERWMKTRHMPAVIAHDPRLRVAQLVEDAGPHLSWQQPSIASSAWKATAKSSNAIAPSELPSALTSDHPAIVDAFRLIPLGRRWQLAV